MFLSASRLQGITKNYIDYDPYFYNLGLLMHMDGANGGTSFPDVMGSIITTQGSPTTSTAQFKVGTASLSLNGSSALRVADKAAFAMGTGDFTVEAWIRPTATANARIWSYQAAGSSTVMIMGRDATGRLFGELRDTSGANDTTVTGSTVMSLNQWYHVAFVRSGTTCYLFVDGVMEGNLGGMNQNITAAVCSIGYYQTGANAFFTGFIDDLRVTKGVARYTSNFTPQNIPFPNYGPDPYFNNVYALLHFDGPNGSTTTTDVKGHAITIGNPATISTAQSKFGGSSLSTTGASTAKASFAMSAIGTQDFTMEFWVRFNTIAGSGADTIVDCRPTSTEGLYPTIYYSSASGGWAFYTNSAARITGGTASINSWGHVALCRVSGVTRLFINGTQVGSNYTDANSYQASTLNIGVNSSANFNLNGYVDDFRLTIGVGRYSTNFTPADVPFSDF